MKVFSLAVVGLATLTVCSAADAKAGKAVYDRACMSCHGPNGVPNPKIEKMMKVKMNHLGAPEVQRMSDAELKQIITKGKGKMRAVSSVSGADLDNVVAYMRTFKK